MRGKIKFSRTGYIYKWSISFIIFALVTNFFTVIVAEQSRAQENVDCLKLKNETNIFENHIAVPPSKEYTADNSAKQFAEWTFFGYLAADNDLESEGLADLAEIKSVGSKNGVNILVLFDGRSVGDTKLYYVEPARLVEIPLTTIDTNWTINELNMGLAETFGKTARWIFENYPAKKHFVVFWDHGGGDGGVCWDETDGNDFLNMSELRQILSESVTTLGKPIDGVGFDACLMSTVEVVYQIKAFVNVVVASEEVVPGDGWPYNSANGGNIVERLVTHPDWSVEEFSQDIVEQYGIRYSTFWYYGVTMAAINVTKFDYLLLPSLNVFVQKLKHRAGTYSNLIRDAQRNTEKYSVFIDLYHFTENILSRINDAEIQTAGLHLKANISSAVIKAWHNSLCPNAHGLSFHFEAAYPSDYDLLWLAKETQVDEFFNAFYSATDIPNQEPFCSIAEPKNSTAVDLRDGFELKGTAADSDGILKVEVKLNRGDWQLAEGTNSWNYTVKPYSLPEGEYVVWVRALDNKGFSNVEKDFSIYQQIRLTVAKGPEASLFTPKGGEQWYINKTYPIVWRINGTAPFRINLFVSVDNGSSYKTIKTNLSQAAEGVNRYDWLADGNRSAYCRIKAEFTDSRSLNTTIVSNVFSLADMIKTIFTAPANHTYLYATETYLIKWSVTGGYLPYRVELYFSKDNGINYTLLHAATQSYEGEKSYSWYINATSVSSKCKFLLNITDANGLVVLEESALCEIVFLPSAELLKPVGGEVLYSGLHYIEWCINDGIPPYDVDIFLTLDGLNYEEIAFIKQTEEGYGKYLWKVDVETKYTTCQLKIVFTDSNGRTATGNTTFFSLIPLVRVSLSQPVGGEIYYSSDNCSVEWYVSGGVGEYNIVIKLSVDGGASYPYFVGNTTQSAEGYGSITIELSNYIASNSKLQIHVRDRYGYTAVDMTDNFTIVPNLKIAFINPRDGDYYYALSEVNITFTISGGYGNVCTAIYYTTDAGLSWKLIASNISTQFYKWRLPLVDTTAMLKLVSTDSYKSTATATSGVFTIWNKKATISGVVLDRTTRLPIANATIWLVELNISTFSADDGKFTFSNLPRPIPTAFYKWTLNITKKGYVPKKEMIFINSTTEEVYVEILLVSKPVPANDLVWLGSTILIICLIVIPLAVVLFLKKRQRKKKEELKISYPQDLIELRKYLYKRF